MDRQQELRRRRRQLTVIPACLALLSGVQMATSWRATAADPPFSNGTAMATAGVLRIAPGTGSLQLATTTGVSIARVANSLAEAQAQSIDLGLIGTSLTAEQCNGDAGALRQDQLPKPTGVDNRKGNANASSEELPLAASALGGGLEEAQADTIPAAHGSVSAITSQLGPVVGISGGRSDAFSRVDPGEAREAEATVSVDIDIAGIVQLRGAQWRAFHRTGAKPSTAGSFSVASSTAGGLPVPVDQLDPLEAALNTALAASGITVDLPSVVHITSPNDVVQVTPLRVTLKDSPVGKAALGPVLNLTRAQREQMFNAIVGSFCQAASLLLVGDVGLNVASGTGFLTVDVGGAQAASADLVIGNPFGADEPFAGLGGSSVLPGGLTTGPTAGVTPGSPGTPGSPAVAAPAGVAAPLAPIAEVGPLESFCESVSPADRPTCSLGGGIPLALLGIFATAGLAGIDWRHRRRLLQHPEPPA
jgi:hypothetical protein